MRIEATQIEQSGPGVELASQPEGLAIQMSDPVPGFEYARNAVTLTFDLSAFETVRLAFAALEYGDEPHAPPAGPFGDNVNFDGVAISVDGVDWYEIQDLRSLRSDRFTAYDIDLNAAIAAVGLSYTSAFRIRFCQYDNNPAPKDGFFLHEIELTGDVFPPTLHLTMDDNAASPTVVDSAAGAQDQTILDSTGNPNTDAHSVPGVVGAALAFDGVDDSIIVPAEQAGPIFAAGTDFSVACWWRSDSDPFPDGYKEVLSNYLFDDGGIILYQRGNAMGTYKRIYMNFYVAGNGAPVLFLLTDVSENIGEWHHYVFQREGTTLRAWRDGALSGSYTDPAVNGDMGSLQDFRINPVGLGAEGALDDFRFYDRALMESEIQELAQTP